jgi:hypothetical protein
MRSRSTTRASILAPLTVLAGMAATADCSSGSGTTTHGASSTSSSSSSSSSTGNPDGGPDLFQADPPAVYVAKVKNLLVGLPPTDMEVKQVTADPTQLATLILGWQKEPQYGLKMKVFFEQAFQQTQITQADFVGLVPKNGISNGAAMPYLVQNLTESFARTVLAMNASGKPFTEVLTTSTLMMTPPVMELYAFLDTYYVDDQGTITDSFATDFPGVSIKQGSGYMGVTLAQAADPTSMHFMQWYDPDPPTLMYPMGPAVCNGVDPITYPGSYSTLQWILYGGMDNHKVPDGMGGTTSCGARAGTSFGQFTMADFGEGAWKMVTIRPPNAGEATTKFYDIPSLRTATELVLKTPHPGFMGTPAFFANWPTNQSNQMRVTANQALIVGTGKQVDGTDKTTVPVATALDAGLDEEHAPPGTQCFGCHQLLDPTRAVLSNTLNYSYYLQETPAMLAQKGLFAFEGVVEPVSGFAGFASELAAHPDFPAAWVQKLCYYANSGPCLATDPEFLRIVDDFKQGWDWDKLVRELFSSPLTTNATPTQTTALAEIVSVTRRDHLCAALDFRLGLDDVCGLSVFTTGNKTTITEIAGGLPSDGYGRGATAPVLPNNPTLFYRAGVENICEAVAGMVIDPQPGSLPMGATSWTSTAPDAAIADFVSLIMAITPSDPRSSEVQTILMNHYNAALASPPSPKKVTPKQALESTFVAACLSPSFVGIGM